MTAKRSAFVLVCGVLLAGSAAHADPRTAQLTAGCQGCHGTTGASADGIPVIAGTLSQAAFVEAMKAFQANTRPATVMNRIARGYSDEEITLLATRYATAN